MKQKIILLASIILFIGGLITIYFIYNKSDEKKEILEQEATDIGIIKINDDNFTEEVLNTDKIVVLEFYENMCPPCTSMIPTLINIAKSNENIKVVMLNTDDENSTLTAKKFEVNATPTIIIFNNGQLIKKFIGATKEKNLMDVINYELDGKNEK